MTKKCEKLCVFCTNFSLSTGYDDTFDSSSGSMECAKNHFHYGGWDSGDENSIRDIIFLARTCEDYIQVKV